MTTRAGEGDDDVNPHQVARRDLQDDERLMRLWAECRKRGWVGRDHAGMLFVFECATHALEQRARNPGALWCWTMKNGRQHITDAELRKAKLRLDAWFRSSRAR